MRPPEGGICLYLPWTGCYGCLWETRDRSREPQQAPSWGKVPSMRKACLRDLLPIPRKSHDGLRADRPRFGLLDQIAFGSTQAEAGTQWIFPDGLLSPWTANRIPPLGVAAIHLCPPTFLSRRCRHRSAGPKCLMPPLMLLQTRGTAARTPPLRHVGTVEGSASSRGPGVDGRS